MSLELLLSHIDPQGAIPPLERWNPPLSGEMDLVIAADGRWIHEGAAISRPQLVRLLSTLLRREDDGEYYLVSPQEKWHVRVEDRPFLIVLAEHEHDAWHMTTNVGDRVALDASHCLQLSDTRRGEQIPEVAIRFGLTARLNRNVFYRLSDVAETRRMGARVEMGFMSAGAWQLLGYLDDDGS